MLSFLKTDLDEALKGRRVAMIVAALWIVGVGLGLIYALQSLRHDSSDGLNNMLQVPFALPWMLLPIGAVTNSNVTDAWIIAGLGCLNAAIVYWWIARRQVSEVP